MFFAPVHINVILICLSKVYYLPKNHLYYVDDKMEEN